MTSTSYEHQHSVDISMDSEIMKYDVCQVSKAIFGEIKAKESLPIDVKRHCLVKWSMPTLRWQAKVDKKNVPVR